MTDLVIRTEKDSETYEFVDVYGNKYEAEFLEELPKSVYDPERLLEKDGYKYYMNENGEVSSKIGITRKKEVCREWKVM